MEIEDNVKHEVHDEGFTTVHINSSCEVQHLYIKEEVLLAESDTYVDTSKDLTFELTMEDIKREAFNEGSSTRSADSTCVVNEIKDEFSPTEPDIYVKHEISKVPSFNLQLKLENFDQKICLKTEEDDIDIKLESLSQEGDIKAEMQSNDAEATVTQCTGNKSFHNSMCNYKCSQKCSLPLHMTSDRLEGNKNIISAFNEFKGKKPLRKSKNNMSCEVFSDNEKRKIRYIRQKINALTEDEVVDQFERKLERVQSKKKSSDRLEGYKNILLDFIKLKSKKPLRNGENDMSREVFSDNEKRRIRYIRQKITALTEDEVREQFQLKLERAQSKEKCSDRLEGYKTILLAFNELNCKQPLIKRDKTEKRKIKYIRQKISAFTEDEVREQFQLKLERVKSKAKSSDRLEGYKNILLAFNELKGKKPLMEYETSHPKSCVKIGESSREGFQKEQQKYNEIFVKHDGNRPEFMEVNEEELQLLVAELNENMEREDRERTHQQLQGRAIGKKHYVKKLTMSEKIDQALELYNNDSEWYVKEFKDKFLNNEFGAVCKICDRLWFHSDLRVIPDTAENIHFLSTFIEGNLEEIRKTICNTCFSTFIRKREIPAYATFNGFKYPPMPEDLPPLTELEEKFVSPRIPFITINRLGFMPSVGQFSVVGTVINVPIYADTMVNTLPRCDDISHNIAVNVKKRRAHTVPYLHGLVNSDKIVKWCKYLVNTELFQKHNIKLEEFNFYRFLEEKKSEYEAKSMRENLISCSDENDEEYRVANQKQVNTLMVDENVLNLAPCENNLVISLLDDEDIEELSFPTVYLGRKRQYRKNVTWFQQAASELRRSDRRGVTPRHILYVFMKILRQRVVQYIGVYLKMLPSSMLITRKMVQNKTFIREAFLKAVPNSQMYWQGKSRDLHAMVRQLGKPTFFITLTASEHSWPYLIRSLYKLKLKNSNRTDGGCDEVTFEDLKKLKSTEIHDLVNEDAVTCVIYFYKLLRTFLALMKNPKGVFGAEHVVLDYFVRIEFQNRGSPHAHMLVWCKNAPSDEESEEDCVKFSEKFITCSKEHSLVSKQEHRHSLTCYKRQDDKFCRFNIPFWPMKVTQILHPYHKSEQSYEVFKKLAEKIRVGLEDGTITDWPELYAAVIKNDRSDEEKHKLYLLAIRATITRSTLLLKRDFRESYINNYHPQILNLLQSNMDVQYVYDVYACASYVSEYFKESDRGFSDLHETITEYMKINSSDNKEVEENQQFDLAKVLGNISTNLLNNSEFSCQECAWFLLRQPMSLCSRLVQFIPTSKVEDRIRALMTEQEMDDSDVQEHGNNIFKYSVVDYYSKRPEHLQDIYLAKFVSDCFRPANPRKLDPRRVQSIIRYCNYARGTEDHRREMVLLYIPWRNEQRDILDGEKWRQLFVDNEDLIIRRRYNYEEIHNLDDILISYEKNFMQNNRSNDDDMEVDDYSHIQNTEDAAK